MDDTEVVPWASKQLYKREIKRLMNKTKKLERELNNCQERRKKHLEFEYEFRNFLVRFEGREWKSEWPFERVLEALIHLKERLP